MCQSIIEREAFTDGLVIKRRGQEIMKSGKFFLLTEGFASKTKVEEAKS